MQDLIVAISILTKKNPDLKNDPDSLKVLLFEEFEIKASQGEIEQIIDELYSIPVVEQEEDY